MVNFALMILINHDKSKPALHFLTHTQNASSTNAIDTLALVKTLHKTTHTHYCIHTDEKKYLCIKNCIIYKYCCS